MEVGLLSKIGFDLEVAIANLVNFLIIFLILKIFFFKPIQEKIDARKEKIKEGLARAEEAESKLKNAEEESGVLLKEAKKEAEEILSDAKKHATKVKEQAVLDGQSERTRILDQAERQIDQDRKKMEEEVEGEMTRLVASLSEKAMKKNT